MEPACFSGVFFQLLLDFFPMISTFTLSFSVEHIVPRYFPVGLTLLNLKSLQVYVLILYSGLNRV